MTILVAIPNVIIMNLGEALSVVVMNFNKKKNANTKIMLSSQIIVHVCCFYVMFQ